MGGGWPKGGGIELKPGGAKPGTNGGGMRSCGLYPNEVILEMECLFFYVWCLNYLF